MDLKKAADVKDAILATVSHPKFKRLPIKPEIREDVKKLLVKEATRLRGSEVSPSSQEKKEQTNSTDFFHYSDDEDSSSDDEHIDATAWASQRDLDEAVAAFDAWVGRRAAPRLVLCGASVPCTRTHGAST